MWAFFICAGLAIELGDTNRRQPDKEECFVSSCPVTLLQWFSLTFLLKQWN